jgi:predicted lipoprotein with Yx(FWY)xxD motif
MDIFRYGAVLALALAGCAQGQPLPQPQAGGFALTVLPSFQAGGFHSQAVIPEFERDDVHHLVLKLHYLTGEVETPVLSTAGAPVAADLSRSELESPITFSQLAPNHSYRIRAYAYKAPGTAPEDLISVSDAASFTDVTLGNDDRPALTPLSVKLIATPFAATTSVALSTSGSVLFDSLDLTLYGLANDAEVLVATRSIRAQDLPTMASFGNLQAMTTYRIAAQAKDFNGLAITGAKAHVDLAVTNDTAAPTASVQVVVP